MNDTIGTDRAVAAFVDRVRARLGDLTEEEREELVGGLEADLSERIAEGGSAGELGDPVAYADELRAAAGLERKGRGRRPGVPARERVGAWLDAGRARLGEVAASRRGAPVWAFLVAVRPVWWVFRAWLAVQLVDMVAGTSVATPVPTLMGVGPGLLVLAVAVVVSVQLGRGLWWPGSAIGTSLWARLVLLGLNAFAVVVAMPVVLAQFPASGAYDDQELYHAPVVGIQQGGELVTNVFPYDAEGRALTGVQLFDQDGKPLSVGRDARFAFGATRVTASYPWLNGGQRLWNVYPLPGRAIEPDGRLVVSPRAWTSANPPLLPSPPLAVVPPASLPTASPSADPSSSPSASPSAGPSGTASPDSEKHAGR